MHDVNNLIAYKEVAEKCKKIANIKKLCLIFIIIRIKFFKRIVSILRIVTTVKLYNKRK